MQLMHRLIFTQEGNTMACTNEYLFKNIIGVKIAQSALCYYLRVFRVYQFLNMATDSIVMMLI
jgi:hypothetical protein